MEIILKENVEQLGRAGEIVKVKPGYARNFLIPKKMAVPANPGNIKVIEQMRQAGAKRDFREKSSAELVARALTQITVEITRKSGESGSLFGSVTGIDIAESLAHHNIEIDKRKILLDEPIKSIGEHFVPVRLHREVTVQIKVVVQAENE
jgi:large subunit ribosomal protein L9